VVLKGKKARAYNLRRLRVGGSKRNQPGLRRRGKGGMDIDFGTGRRRNSNATVSPRGQRCSVVASGTQEKKAGDIACHVEGKKRPSKCTRPHPEIEGEDVCEAGTEGEIPLRAVSGGQRVRRLMAERKVGGGDRGGKNETPEKKGTQERRRPSSGS